MRILVVEDNPRMANMICDALRDACYAVDLACDSEPAMELLDFENFDLIVLDWMLPGTSGLDLLRNWRRQGHQLPILMLSARDEIEDRIGGLDAGADDYLTKPFAVGELLARVRSLLRRRGKSLQTELCAGDLRMSRAQRLVTVAGRAVDLSPKEFALLEYLLSRKEEVVSRTDIETHVWDTAFDSMGNVVDVVIHRLRKKIDGGLEERLLHTVRGAGYVLRSDRTRS